MSTTGTQIDPRFMPVVVAQAAATLTLDRVYLVRPSDSTRATGAQDAIADEFEKHAKKWLKETLHISSPIDKYLHESYARIIGLGYPAVRHILTSLRAHPADWFYALRAITGENPVPDNAAGDVERMTEAWLQWGNKRGLA